MDEQAFIRASADGRCLTRRAPPEAADAPNRGLFWIRRLALLLEEMLASDGTDPDLFMHSDLDAFWLGDVATLLVDQRFDLAFTMDHGHPATIGRDWGFTLCPGLFAARSGPALAAFARLWMAETQRYSDDQNAVNYIVRDLGIKWRPRDLGGHAAVTGEVEVEGQSVSILVLPRTLCDRVLPLETDRELVAAHPFFDRRFRTATVRLLSRFTMSNGTYNLPEDLRLPIDARPSLRRNLLLRAVFRAVGSAPLTSEEIHYYAALEAGHGDIAKAVALFDAALAKGGDPGAIGIDSHMVFHQVGRAGDAKTALSAAVAGATASETLRRLAANARVIGAPALALYAMGRIAWLSVGDPHRIARRFARIARRYTARR